jgi:alpha-galactosidase
LSLRILDVCQYLSADPFSAGSQNTPVIEQVRSMDVRLNPAFGSPTTLHQLRGSAAHAEAWLPVNQVIGQGSVAEFGAEAGRPAKAISPFFTLDWGDGGVVTAVGWSGQWQGRIERTDQGQVRMQAGMQFLHLSLRPGESIRTPRVLQVHWQGADRDTAHNLFRRTMLKHIMPQMDGQPVMPPIAHLSTSFYELDRTDEANTLSHLHALHGLGFETFWLDAYWIRDGFPNGVGHYG